jgi:hypothetical protein
MNVKSQPKVMNFIFSSFEGNKCHLDKTKYKRENYVDLKKQGTW